MQIQAWRISSDETPIASSLVAHRSKLSRSPRKALDALGGLLVVMPLLFPSICRAVPSFARQLDMQCIDCHSEFPILTEMGRQFKLTAYTMSAGQTELPPIALMLEPSFTQTQAGQAGGAAPGFKNNDNYALSQASIFYAGRLFGPYATEFFGADAASFLNKFGIFSQTTYDGVAKAWAWDNTDVRYADVGSVSGDAVIYGIYLNNNPTLSDPWNSTPAFGFPFSGSGLAPTPAAGAMIDGGLAGEVGGLGTYAMIDNHFYFDLAFYRTLGSRYQHALGVDPTGEPEITGLAPYWRFAYTRPIAGADWEIGTFGMAANTFPGRDSSAGSDHTADFGLDSQLQKSVGRSDIVALLTAIYEKDGWNASQPLGNTSNASDSLRELRVTIDYLFDKTYGAAIQHFTTTGTSDSALYGSSQTGSPNSDGFILQANYLPFNKRGGPPFWPRSNIKFSLQYVYYNRFDGSSTNIDGAGRKASDNNTLYLQAWLMF